MVLLSVDMPGSLTRRAFLAILGAFAPLWPARAHRDGRDAPSPAGPVVPLQHAGPQEPITLDGFLALSERLTGHRPLDRATARVYLDALLEPAGNRLLLLELGHSRSATGELPPALAALEAQIVQSWYTGVHVANGTAQVAAYSGALMWKVLGRPAPGSCRGEAGEWSRAPETKS